MRVAAFRLLLLASTVLVAACGKTHGMIRHLPDSTSLVLKAAQIVQVRVDRVEAPNWGDQVTRQARLHITVTDVWKGWLSPGPLVLTVMQNRPDEHGFTLPPQGCWQDGRRAAGEQWVAFTKSTSDVAVEALAEDSCLQLAPAAEAAIDVRIAEHIESGGLSLPAIVKLVISGADRLHVTFAQYLRARFADLHLEEKENLNAVLELVATPALTTPVRATLLDAVESYISSSQATTDWHIHRLAVAMFGLLMVRQASDMHENLIETDLPNLLGLTGGAQKQSAKAVFEQWPRERTAAAQALALYRGPANAKPLLDWIRER